jgi:hypothetical protein
VTRERSGRGDAVAFGEAVLTLAALRIALAVLPFRIVHRVVLRLARAVWGRDEPTVPRDPTLVARAVLRGARVVRGSRCLARALAGLLLSARRGEPARVCIGVRKDVREPFGAHAWLETPSGVTIGGEEARDFAPLLVLDPFGVGQSSPIGARS